MYGLNILIISKIEKKIQTYLVFFIIIKIKIKKKNFFKEIKY